VISGHFHVSCLRACRESFNRRRLRDECLNVHQFRWLAEA
jgi:hypothetical protein